MDEAAQLFDDLEAAARRERAGVAAERVAAV